MQCNIGKIDAIVRVVIALAIFGAGVVLQSWWGLLGLIPLGTAIVRWCPLYTPLGINTCRSGHTSGHPSGHQTV